MVDYSKLIDKSGTIYAGSRAFKDPTELGSYLGIQSNQIDWSKIQKQAAAPADTTDWYMSEWSTTGAGAWKQQPSLRVGSNQYKFNTPQEYLDKMKGLTGTNVQEFTKQLQSAAIQYEYKDKIPELIQAAVSSGADTGKKSPAFDSNLFSMKHPTTGKIYWANAGQIANWMDMGYQFYNQKTRQLTPVGVTAKGQSQAVQTNQQTNNNNMPKYKTLLQIYGERPDLQKAFPQKGTALDDWWNVHGVKEYAGTTLVQPGDKRLTAPPTPTPTTPTTPTTAPRDTSHQTVYKNGQATTVQAWEVPSYLSRGYTSSYTPPAATPPAQTPGQIGQAPPQQDQTPRPAQITTAPPQATSSYQPTLIEITSQRPDVMAEANKQGGDPYTAGTPANTWLNDWYNRVGKAEGADMAAKGMFDQPTDDTTIPTDTTTPTDTIEKAGVSMEDKFTELKDTLKTSQEEAKKAQEDLMTKTTEDTMKQFQDMQKSMMEGYNAYFDEQSKFLEEMRNQPSAVDQLNQFREQQGLPQMEQMLKGIDQTILDTEGLLTNIEGDIRARTEGLPVSEAAARRLTAMEQGPLTKQMDELLRSRARAAAGLSQKQATVDQYMTSAQADVERQRQDARDRLGFAKDKMEFVSDMAEKSYDMFAGIQDKLFDVNLENITSDRDYKQKLAELGFDFFTQQQAAVAAQAESGAEFERELLLKQFEHDLKMSNPEVKSVQSFTDASGNVTQMLTYQDGSSEQISLGRIGKGTTPRAGDSYSQKDLDKIAADKEKSFWTEIDQGKAMLQDGENWGSVWNRIKTQFPEIPDEVIDQVLGKEDWYEGGAYEEFKAKGKTSSGVTITPEMIAEALKTD